MRRGLHTAMFVAIGLLSLQATPRALTVSPLTATILVGETVQAASSPSGSQWSSSNLAIATVSPSGVVTGVSPGTATITAKLRGARATILVTVRAPQPQPAPLAIVVQPPITIAATSPTAVTLPAVVFTGGTPPVFTSIVPASGSVFPIGVTTVTMTAVDQADATVTSSYTVTLAVPPPLPPDLPAPPNAVDFVDPGA